MDLWGTMVCLELSEMGFWGVGVAGKQKKETEKTDLVRNYLCGAPGWHSG